MSAVLSDQAAAKVNLTLRVLGKRADGYHDLESLVVFARQVGDQVALQPAEPLGLCVDGPTAAAAGDLDDNLVLRAAKALGGRIVGVRLGRVPATQRIPEPPRHGG